MSYSIAKERPHQLYFDERNWTTADIRIFFEDLKYADYATWERTTHKLTGSFRTNVKAEKRYKLWLDQQEKMI